MTHATDSRSAFADLTQWQPCPRPERVTLNGLYTRLEPLTAAQHGDALFAASMQGDAERRFRYLFESPQQKPMFDQWLSKAVERDDPLFYAVINLATGRCEGRQALMRITPEHGVIEIGSILWGDAIARTRVCTEALALTAQYVFDTLGYRRFEWKCHADNAPSRRAALRFGFQFEGIFRQHMVHKGGNRDTAWFAMTDHDWREGLSARYQRWLSPDNFDAQGQQYAALRDL